MYGKPADSDTSSKVTEDLSSIRVGLIAERTGQDLRNQLEFLLDPNSSSSPRQYTLNITLSEKEDTLAVERSGLATRANVEITANFKLIEDTTGSPVLGGTTRAVSGYNLLDNDFSTQTSKGDARKRVVDQLAYEIRNRLAAHFTQQGTATAGGGS